MIFRFGRGIRWVMVFGMAGSLGCSGKKAQQPYAAAEERLLKIGNAYINASNRLGRAPRDFEEIQPYFEKRVSADWLRSPHDGEMLVIIWGVDYNKLLPGRTDPFMVGGYEKKGVSGKRYVLRFPRSVVLLTDEEFRKCNFPPGHKSPG